MLEHLLRILAGGTPQHLRGLADQLGVTEELLEVMIDDLVRRGYLEPLRPECQGGCRACPLQNACNTSSTGRLWMLTESGRALANR